MILLIDKAAATRARYLNRDRSASKTYYLLDDAIIVCRNGLSLPELVGKSVDCLVGWDVAQPGFAREEDTGKKRTKVTILHILRHMVASKTLSEQLKGEKW